jgi:ureidoglycolate lyase
VSAPTLAVEPLTKAAFGPFGEVIEAEGAQTRVINDGYALRRHDLARIDAGGGRPVLSIFEARRRPFPLAINMLERHPLGSQAFFPLNPEPWLAVVAEGAEAPDPATLRCFRARGDQGVNYARGVWHFPVLTLAPRQNFLVVDRDGPGDNLEEKRGFQVVLIEAPAD